MQLTHTFSDLLGCCCLPHFFRGQGYSVEELLEATVGERSQHAWTYPLPGQALQYAEFVIPIDQVLDVGPVDSQQQLLGLFLNNLRVTRGQVFRWCHNIDCIGQGAAQSLNLDVLAGVESHASPAFEPKRMCEADNLVLEICPSLPLFLFPLARYRCVIVRGRIAVFQRFRVVKYSIATRHHRVSVHVVGVRRIGSRELERGTGRRLFTVRESSAQFRAVVR